MANLKISELPALAGADLAAEDLVVAVDTSAAASKKLTIGDLIANGVTLIADDAIPGAKICLPLVVLLQQTLPMLQ